MSPRSGPVYRLKRALSGTAFAIVGMLLVAFPCHCLMEMRPLFSLGGLVLQMLCGALLLGKGLEHYDKASFPPDSAGLADPVSAGLQMRLDALKQRSWTLWALAILGLLFTPFFTAVFLPFVLLRPFYTTFHSSGPYAEVFIREVRLTARYLFEVGKGLMVLFLCSSMALTSGLLILLYAIYSAHR